MSTTQENLMAAFAGESQANRKYLAFAAAADKEGMHQVAKLFRAAAAAETVHAHAHLKNAGKIGNTMANLKSAIEGETYEFTTMYPDMIKQAQAEGQSAVAKYLTCQSGGRNPRQALPKGSGKSRRSARHRLLRVQGLRLYPRRPLRRVSCVRRRRGCFLQG
jgi:Rubrerythrin